MSNLISNYVEEGKQFRIVGDISDSKKNICKKVIEGDLFIIPNLAMSVSNYFSQERFDSWIDEKVEEVADTMDMRTHDLSADRFIQIWATSPRSENWCDHGMGIGYGHFPSHIPARWLEGLREDDVLVIAGVKNRFYLRCRQDPYRYGSMSPFERCLESVNKDYVSKL